MNIGFELGGYIVGRDFGNAVYMALITRVAPAALLAVFLLLGSAQL
jgi:hypothetical protein